MTGVGVDTVRAFASYGIAAFVVGMGLLIIYMTRDEPSAGDLRVLIGGFIGFSLQFVYGQEVQTRTARQAAAQTVAAASTNGHSKVPVDSEPPKV